MRRLRKHATHIRHHSSTYVALGLIALLIGWAGVRVLFFTVATSTPPLSSPTPTATTELHPIPTTEDQAAHSNTSPAPAAPPAPQSTYIAITESCDAHFDGTCVRARSGPGLDFPTVARLRTGMVLKTAYATTVDDLLWHKVVFDEWIRYPERLTNDWFISGTYTESFKDIGEVTLEKGAATPEASTKRIIIDRSTQTLTAYDGEEIFMHTTISTGLELTPTPRGTFTIFRKTPSRYMQGPLPDLVDQQMYDLPGVPWNLYFTREGAVIHGAYWHNSFGSPYSHGCVNMRPSEARALYTWAPLGTTVTVRD